ncbi:MAG TPA: aldehyde dehydrogenase family protein [bacterium]|jgi:aldehyde dehydrogenase (NAD+)/betaine-aldehyde dehydrogenase
MTTLTPIQEKKATDTVYSNLIGGKRVPAKSGRTLPITNPATGESLGTCPASDAADVDAAVKVARNALDGKWGRMAPGQRTKLLFRAAQLLDERAAELAEIESRNNGKVVAHVMGEIKQAVEDLEFFAGAVTKVSGSVPPLHGAFFGYTVKEPVGVVGAITPWNYPLMLEVWKLAPALAAGCTVVLKPSELTPITANLLAEILLEAGIPEGVVNVVHGLGAEAGAALVSHPDVDKITFTGGTVTGRAIMREAAATMKRLTLELGGKSPAIVCEDAVFEDALYGSLFSIFYSAGQSCEARSRIYVHESIYDKFVDRFVSAAQALKVGDPMDKATHIGALVSPERMALMDSFVEAARRDGGRILTGGHRLTEGPLARGNFYAPTVIDNLPESSRCVQEEIFGPIAVISKWTNDEEVIGMANGVIYGLAAAVWTQNLNRAQKFVRAIRSGIVAVNTFATALPGLPFGGYKQSGFGRELSLETMEAYLETKTVLIGASGKPVNPFGLKA